MKVDLHLHSNASDGALAPADVVRAARAAGLDLIALTDHDTVGGIGAARAAAAETNHAIRVVPGIEISSTHDDFDLHILGYLIDPEHPGIIEYGRAASTARRRRMRRMIRRLHGLGVAIGFDDVLAAAGPDTDTLGRPHLAQALVERGHVDSFAEAFDRFIADHAPAFVPTALPGPRSAIELIHAAGGVAVWAHPRFDDLETELDRLVDWGLDGLECLRPQNSAATTRRLARTARERGLLITGGSDWHDDRYGPLGSFHLGPDDIPEFAALAGL